MNIVYLVIVITTGGGNLTSQTIPQANMKQCQINAKYFKQSELRKKSIETICIVGTK